MKKLWIALLSAMVVFAIAMPASAVDVKFTGTYHIWGVFDKNHSLVDGEALANVPVVNDYATGQQYGSQSFFQQRLRLQTDFKIVEGLTLVTRFDALEKKWGDQRWTGPQDSYSRLSTGVANVYVQENIEFERAYVDFNTAIGKIQAGYLNFVSWGTEFGNTNLTRPGIKYIAPIGPVTVIAAWEKSTENVSGRPTSIGPQGFYADADNDIFDLGFIWKGKGLEAGAIWQYGRNATGRPTTGYLGNLHAILPYFKATFGPVYLEGEMVWLTYKAKSDIAGLADIKGEEWAIALGTRVDLAPVYFGLAFAWIQGDDPATTKVEGGWLTALKANQSYNPALMMFNDDFTTWLGDRGSGNYRGAISSATSASTYMGTAMDNVWFYHLYVGVKPVPKADIKLAFTYAYADEKPYANTATGVTTEFNSNKYGYELDLVASYKIYDNLEYMVGAGYFWPGDYFKGCYNSAAGAGCWAGEPELANDYLLMHKLTLSF